MELTPSQVSGATFRTVRKGYDPDEVQAFLGHVAAALEEAQQQATAMEARARAAVARLQEVSAAQEEREAEAPSHEQPTAPLERPEPSEEAAEAETEVRVSADEAETISRTLLLAQRTADNAVAEAEAEAERIKNDARAEAETTIDSTREMSAKLLEEAKLEARKVSESERQAAENEVQSLKARREFLVGDVDQLETFLGDQRERLRAAAHQIEALCDRVPAGLGEVPPPALSASDDEPGDDTAELFIPPEAAGPFATIGDLASTLDEVEGVPFEREPTTEQEVLDIPPGDAPELPTRDAAN
ncbi:MAG: DivIVA domain-containing protein [Ilumatobacter sp.]|uniref:DivIVA domain-containing protein n=1 Tax=Ilumatobacter sp. TaxID=1967498 RepID=UPI0026297B67|nr:DivIVA domain-containing protein [Ilumatobacter sp.]MDJ0767551.1 DivIVA domain-containing protein [Ilumatobacter sp.]